MNQHTFVAAVQKFYKENDIQPGDPNEGAWEEAHFPAPKDEGDNVILLLHEHHQVQGLLQSEEFEKTCFFSAHTKKFLDSNWCENWFELCELHEKWASFGATQAALASHRERDSEGKSVKCLNRHDEKDEDGKSILAKKMAKAAHSKKDEKGRSLVTLRAFGAVHDEKDDDGKSLFAKSNARKSAMKTSKAVQLVSEETGEVFWFCSTAEAARELSLNQSNIAKALRKGGGRYKKFIITPILGENPFF